jgi:anti-anti-sigma regulatory factor
LVEPGDKAAVVRVTDRVLCERTVRGLRRHLPWLVGEPGRRGLHLDLGSVRVPTAGGLGGLVALHGHLRAAGGQFVLFNVGAQAHEVFRLTGLTDLLDVRPQEEWAASGV